MNHCVTEIFMKIKEGGGNFPNYSDFELKKCEIGLVDEIVDSHQRYCIFPTYRFLEKRTSHSKTYITKMCNNINENTEGNLLVKFSIGHLLDVFGYYENESKKIKLPHNLNVATNFALQEIRGKNIRRMIKNPEGKHYTRYVFCPVNKINKETGEKEFVLQKIFNFLPHFQKDQTKA